MKNDLLNSQEMKQQITLQQIKILHDHDHDIDDNLVHQSPVCRICLDGENKKQLIQPCLCDGSIGYVHQFCLISYVTNKLSKQQISNPKKLLKYRCELCRIELYFNYTVKYKVNCHPLAEGKRFTSWIILLVLLVLFSLVETLMLIMIIVYYNGFTDSFLFSEGKIWIIITVTPLLALGLVIITFYFICENLYGGITIQKVLGKGKKNANNQDEEALARCIPLIGYVLLEPQYTQ